MKTVIPEDRTPIAYDRSKERHSMKTGVVTRDLPEIEVIGARLAIVAAVSTLLLLVGLHILSPAFDPSFRMVSEYALGRDAWVLSLMFLAWGISSCALALALCSQVKTRAGKVGLWFLVIAAVWLSVSLGRLPAWRGARSLLLYIANLNWISVVLLGATLVLMTVQFAQVTGGHLPQHAPTHLPTALPSGKVPGVIRQKQQVHELKGKVPSPTPN